MFSVASLLATSGVADVEVGHMPVFDEAAKCTYLPESLKLAEALDGENIGRLESLMV